MFQQNVVTENRQNVVTNNRQNVVTNNRQQLFFSSSTHKSRVNNLTFSNIVFIQQSNDVREKLFDRINILTFDFEKRRLSSKFS